MSDSYENIRRKIDSDLDRLIDDVRELKKDLDKMMDYIIRDKQEYERASEGQIRYIKTLYKKLSEEPPENLGNLSKREASKLIDRLKKRLGW